MPDKELIDDRSHAWPCYHTTPPDGKKKELTWQRKGSSYEPLTLHIETFLKGVQKFGLHLF